MSLVAGCNRPREALRHRLTFIPAHKPVILELPSKNTKTIVLEPGKTIELGKFGSFAADELIGLPYGLKYEISPVAAPDGSESASASDSAVEPKKPKSRADIKHMRAKAGFGKLSVLIDTPQELLVETTATNEHIYDDNDSQALTSLEITELKAQGITGDKLVELVAQRSASFAKRTVYSQEKFRRKKAEKHLTVFVPRAPTAHQLASATFDKRPPASDRPASSLRADALAQVLTLGEIRAGGRYIVVDGTNGLLTGAMLERMGVDGHLLLIHDADSPPAHPIMKDMNLPAEATEDVMHVLNWAQVDPLWNLPDLPLEPEGGLPEARNAASSQGERVNSRDIRKFKRRRQMFAQLEATRQDLFAGDFDALVVATAEYDPFAIIEQLTPYIAGSGQIVVHTPFLQPLIETHARMRVCHEYIAVTVGEPWLRRYQVLPGRTHPEMSTSATGGYLLHALRVLP